MKKIKICDIYINFVKRQNQKTIRLFVNKDNQITLSAPFFCSEKTAIDFAFKHQEWIKEKTSKTIQETTFHHKDIVSILGTNYNIIHNPNAPSYTTVEEDTLFIGGEEQFIHRKISTFAKKELLKYIQEKAINMGKIIGKKPLKISLKNTTSRWGSCSSKGNLNFCWKIAFAPLYVINYLIAHEVAHLKEMNHSQKFWETVALFNTEQAKAEIWLRKNGKDLISIK